MARNRRGSYNSARTKSKAAVFAEMLSSTEDKVKAEAVDMPSWSSLTGKPTNIATTDQLPTVPSNIVTHDGFGNVTLAGDLTANDVVIS